MQFLRNSSVVPRLYWFKHLQKIRFEEKKIFNMTSSLTISEVYEMERRYLRLNSRWNIWEALENRFSRTNSTCLGHNPLQQNISGVFGKINGFVSFILIVR